MKGDEKALDYREFYNRAAINMIKWMQEETNTTKRAKLYRTACRLEYRFRKYVGIGKDGIWLGNLPYRLWAKDLVPKIKPKG